VGEEFLDCLHGGVIPIYLASPNILTYLHRNIMFLPYYFDSPEAMAQLIARVTDGMGILHEGVRMSMTHESNHYLSKLYWQQVGNYLGFK
jgi:hypothetical protein